MFDLAALRAQFPFFQYQDPSYAYLDNAATTQKPQQVIAAESQFYSQQNASIHRANHQLARTATEQAERIRARVAQLIGAQETAEVVWTRGTTESINLVAYSYGRFFLRAGDEVLISQMEHHANIVPWQLTAQAVGATIKVIPVDDDGTIDLATYAALFTAQTRLVCISHVSNAIGTLNPIKQLIDIAHVHGARVCVDGAQAVAHVPVDVSALDCDFYAFSGHKMYGPTGIGVLYGKRALLEQMPPYQAGGAMIDSVSFTSTVFNQLPFKFEAGTPHMAGIIGLGAAIDFIATLDRVALRHHETELLQQLYTGLTAIPTCRVLTPIAQSCASISFVLDGVHPSDLEILLDQMGVAVRGGTQCAMPLFTAWQLPGAIRVSLACYTSQAEIAQFFHALQTALTLLST